MMIDKIILLFWILLFCSSCTATQTPVAAEYPEMPDAYRDNDKNKANRNPIGMSIYDAAEKEAEEEYFGAEVISLEESRRILKERREAEEGKTGSSGKSPE
ncbi:MAG: hypothetical protein K9K37_05655 [Desulfocapsa sp.]|nr:hypothetical protein [Desulfocapsa sp.]